MVELASITSSNYTSNPQTFPLSQAYTNFKYLLIRGTAGSGNTRKTMIIPTSEIDTTERTFHIDFFGWSNVTSGVGTQSYSATVFVKFPSTSQFTVERITNNANFGIRINKVYGLVKS